MFWVSLLIIFLTQLYAAAKITQSGKLGYALKDNVLVHGKIKFWLQQSKQVMLKRFKESEYEGLVMYALLQPRVMLHNDYVLNAAAKWSIWKS